MGADSQAFNDICLWRILWHEKMRFDSGSRRIDGYGASSIARRRRRHLTNTKKTSQADCGGHSARLKSCGRVLGLVFNVKFRKIELPAKAWCREQRCPALVERHRINI